MWKFVAGTLLASSVSYCIIQYFSRGACRCTSRLDGLVVVVTGVNSGIGKALCFELAKRGATLVLACRNVEEGVKVKDDILKQNVNGNVEVFVRELDLNSFDSIVKFSNCIREDFSKIYALVNNAGVFYHPQQLTVDNFDVTLQTNYLGPFVLTHHLFKLLNLSIHARVINVCSEAHRHTNVYDLKAITKCQTEFRSHFKAYSVSKLALLLFTREFARKLQNTNVLVNAVNPGNVETSLYRYYPRLSNPWLYALQWPIRFICVKSPNQGAQSILHSLLTPNRSTGQYFSDCKLKLPSPNVLNDKLCNDYYNLTLELLDTKFLTESEC